MTLADVIAGSSRWCVEPADLRFALGGFPDCSVDAVVCDPPYGLSKQPNIAEVMRHWIDGDDYAHSGGGFMGKTWDSFVPGPSCWREVYRVMKPGAHLLAFAGTRTFDLMAVSIRFAGFEVRDSLAHMYASGFPKSLDVSKAIDAALGAEREVVGSGRGRTGAAAQPNGLSFSDDGYQWPGTFDITAPATPQARAAAGYGTALKPAWECVVVAQKPLALSQLCGILAQRVLGAVCKLRSCASAAENGSASRKAVRAEGFGSALWDAVERCSTPDDLSALTDTWPSGLEIPSSLNIALSWLATLAETSALASTFTTETASSLTTDLKTLNCSPSPITPESIIRAAIGAHGTGSSVSLAGVIFSAVRSRLEVIRAVSAHESATSPEDGPASRPELCPIIVARKPLEGTVAANFMRWGTGGLNVDGCRVECRDNLGVPQSNPANRTGVVGSAMQATGGVERNQRAQRDSIARTMDLGRWPPNVILDESQAAALDAQSGIRPGMSGGGNHRDDYEGGMFGAIDCSHTARGDTGGASRFFFVAKASTAEREMGLAHLPPRTAGELTGRKEGSAGLTPRAGAGRASSGRRNTHPTVKPVELMRWLVRLVTPPGGVVLDPFTGSGTTGIATMLEGDGRRFVGFDLDPYHVEIARARIAHVIGGGYERAVETEVQEERQPSLFGGAA